MRGYKLLNSYILSSPILLYRTFEVKKTNHYKEKIKDFVSIVIHRGLVIISYLSFTYKMLGNYAPPLPLPTHRGKSIGGGFLQTIQRIKPDIDLSIPLQLI